MLTEVRNNSYLVGSDGSNGGHGEDFLRCWKCSRNLFENILGTFLCVNYTSINKRKGNKHTPSAITQMQQVLPRSWESSSRREKIGAWNRRWREANFNRKCWETETGSFLYVVDDGIGIWSESEDPGLGSRMDVDGIHWDTGHRRWNWLGVFWPSKKNSGKEENLGVAKRGATLSSYLARGL